MTKKYGLQKGKIGQYLLRVCYHPDPAMVRDRREWGIAWWKYCHLAKKCLANIDILTLQDWKAQVNQGRAKLIVELEPLPERFEETTENRKRIEERATSDLFSMVAEIQLEAGVV